MSFCTYLVMHEILHECPHNWGQSAAGNNMRLRCYYREETCCVGEHFFTSLKDMKLAYLHTHLHAHEGVCMGVGSNNIVRFPFYLGGELSCFNMKLFTSLKEDAYGHVARVCMDVSRSGQVAMSCTSCGILACSPSPAVSSIPGMCTHVQIFTHTHAHTHTHTHTCARTHTCTYTHT